MLFGARMKNSRSLRFVLFIVVTAAVASALTGCSISDIIDKIAGGGI